MKCTMCNKDIESATEVAMHCCNDCYLEVAEERYTLVPISETITELDFDKETYDDIGC